MQELQNEIFKDAMATGIVNLETRKKLLKYKNYYEKL